MRSLKEISNRLTELSADVAALIGEHAVRPRAVEPKRKPPRRSERRKTVRPSFRRKSNGRNKVAAAAVSADAPPQRAKRRYVRKAAVTQELTS
jgi:hypothetical protein